ncbi:MULTISPECIES: VWA domain-containing protein [unclassified Clostridium]|uniref:VWA domain-containing protein n=1 Tax=unclassified Clostridium TaxID=2614128 RepID=UPI00189B1E56|nr:MULTISPECIES: VWA domain-containing protein [unclassified Clostridium]MBP3915848.1 VWA domain-containing protein [Clostridium sp.]MEE0931763.1 VWA domain-containing protein [Clostridium sp.]
MNKINNNYDKNTASNLNKWRLILGKYANNQIEFSDEESGIKYMNMDNALDFLYGREYGEEDGVRKEKRKMGSLGPSNLTVPSWIIEIRKLFPKETVEILEKHALDKYELTELLTDKEVLEKLEPNEELLKNILQMKHLLKGEVLETAKIIVKKVAEDITKKLENDVKKAIVGQIDRNKSSLVKNSRNIDFKKTIKANLKNYDVNEKSLVIDKIYFNDRVKRYNPWNVIIAVDESGSMLDSVIHSAIMAGIFSKLPMLKTNLVIFDTEVVDLSGYIDEPVETLMSIQLGGGTNITKALTYCEGLIENPHRTIVILVSDLYEGYDYKRMYGRVKSIIESGAKLIVLTALNMEAEAVYDKNAAKNMAALGAEVASMTPGGLAEWIGKILS